MLRGETVRRVRRVRRLQRLLNRRLQGLRSLRGLGSVLTGPVCPDGSVGRDGRAGAPARAPARPPDGSVRWKIVLTVDILTRMASGAGALGR